MLYYPTLYGVPYIAGGSDDLFFEKGSKMLASMGHFVTTEDIRAPIGTSHKGYHVFLTNLIVLAEKIDSYHTVLPRLINILCAAMISGFTYILGIHVGLNRKIASFAAILFGIHPSVLFFSSVVLRSLIIAFLASLVVLGYILAQSGKVNKVCLGLFLLFISALVLFYFRSWQVPAMGVLILLSYILTKSKVKGFYKVCIVTIAVVLLLLAVRSPIENSFRIIGGSILRDKHMLGIPQLTHAERQNAGLARYIFNQPFPLNLPLQVAYALVSPIPQFSRNLTTLHSSFFSLLFTLCLPALFIGSQIAWKVRKIRWLDIVFWGLFIGIAMSSFKGRQFIQTLPYCFILMGLGWQYAPKKVLSWIRIWGIIVLFLGVIYYSLKLC
ncbi:MAG: hypothetical protein GH151_11085 [Bacteroidetes bacterium]|nr:hypothetical protein [Bacteroidota bacterium]